MNISALFIRRPVTTTLVMLGLVLFGIMGYKSLPVSDLPAVDFPTIQVSAGLPGASPETMAATVAKPLENQFATISGLDQMTSSSTLGNTRITLQFDLDRDIDGAATDVTAMISKATPKLPRDLPIPPFYQKVNPAEKPILYLGLSSPSLPLYTINDYAENLISQKISMISGVSQVMVYGAQKFAVRVQVNPNALATRKIGIDEVAEAVRRGNVDLPTGTLYGPHQAYTVRADGQLFHAAAYRPLIVAYRDGKPVRLRDLGRVIDSVQNDKNAAWINQARGVILAVKRQIGTNTIKIVDKIKNLLPQFREILPASVNLSTIYDRSESIRASFEDVKFTLFLTISLVILVIFLFLRNVSATIIPTLAILISIIGTFAVMYLEGYSLDNLSLMALTLSVGFVVDDAVVMLENIVRHLEMGKDPWHAAFDGSQEISFTIVSMTLSLAAVFIPVLFMGGIIGRLLHEFAVVIAVAILISGFVALSLTPMLCSRYLRPSGDRQHGRLFNLLERFFERMLHLYDWSLKKVLNYRLTTMIISGIVLLATIHLFIIIPKGFLPTQDTGFIFGMTQAAQDISFDNMVRHQQALAKIAGRNPAVANSVSVVGYPASNSGILVLSLKPRHQRRFDAQTILQQLRPKLATVPGIMAFLQVPPAIQVGGRLTKNLYQFTLQGFDTQELFRYAPQLEAKLRQRPEFQDVTSDLEMKSLHFNVRIDRDKASALGITAQQIEDALRFAYASNQVGYIYTSIDQYYVIVETEPQYQQAPSDLSKLYIRAANNSSGNNHPGINQSGHNPPLSRPLVPLDTIAEFTRSLGPLTVNHTGQFPSVTISFNLAPKVALSQAVTILKKLSLEVLPATITTSLQGQAQAFEQAQQGLGLLLFMSIMVIYIILGILYESFIHPLTILSGLPAAGLGALIILMLFGMDLNLFAFVGIIMLVGIVKKNAIMMIDFAIEAERHEGKSALEAIYQGCLIRFRPIMMTTMAALMGAMPIAFGMGAGSEMRRPLGLAVVGGLLISQLITLYITPVIYTYFDAFQERFGHRFRKRRRPQS